MKKTTVSLSVTEATNQIRQSLEEKGFTIFSDIDHQENAIGAKLEMPASRVLIFGNPVAGTKLMQKDITMSFDLPLRIAVVDNDGDTQVIHQTTADYVNHYQVQDHPVLEKIEALFSALVSELSS